MTPAEVQDIAARLEAALSASDDPAPAEAMLAFRLLAGAALNLASLAHPTGDDT